MDGCEPSCQFLTNLRQAIESARGDHKGSRAHLRKLSDQVFASRPGCFCAFVARAEVAAYYSGLRTPEHMTRCFNQGSPRDFFTSRLVVDLLEAGGLWSWTRDAHRNETSPGRAGYVYLAQSGKYYLIGRSVSPRARKSQLSIALPEEVVVRHAIMCHDAAAVKGYWHRRFANNYMRGDWFDLAPDDVAEFCSWLATERSATLEGGLRLKVRLRALGRRSHL